ncbi:MAG: 50S ribosomal protein L31e [Candidatus Aenigmatarchaeota archaeon]
MAEEKLFTIPLRSAFLKGRKRRAKNATTIVRKFLQKHMKSDAVKIGSSINHAVWARGIQKPPRRVRVHAIKEENIVYAELVGTEIKPPAKEEVKKKKEKKKEKKEKIREERKERKKKTLEEEIKEEKEASKGIKKEEKPKEEAKEEKPREEKKEEAPKQKTLSS